MGTDYRFRGGHGLRGTNIQHGSLWVPFLGPLAAGEIQNHGPALSGTMLFLCAYHKGYDEDRPTTEEQDRLENVP